MDLYYLKGEKGFFNLSKKDWQLELDGNCVGIRQKARFLNTYFKLNGKVEKLTADYLKILETQEYWEGFKNEKKHN